MHIQVLSTACYTINFNGTTLSANLCRVKRSFKTYHKEHDSVKETQKKAKNHVRLTGKFPWQSCFTTHLPSLSSNTKVLKAFPKTFPTKIKPAKCATRRKKMRQEKRKKIGEERQRKEKVKTAVSLLNPKTIFKFYFLRKPELHKLIICMCIRGPQNVHPANSFVVSFNSL